MTHYIGLMSGTSLDGVDGVLVSSPSGIASDTRQLAAIHIPFSTSLRTDLMALQAPGDNEIHREALLANQLAHHYADCVGRLLVAANLEAAAITVIGVHGQTVRHRPELGYTRQINNPSLVAELTGIDVVADFRSRDIAAGGQGAPLVPAYHRAVFGKPGTCRVVANIGGISNISILDGTDNATIIGFDTGPGNLLMDGWIARHRGQSYDADGAWAATGVVDEALLSLLRAEPFFQLPPPKSTGRDLFDLTWLDRCLGACGPLAPADVQATLTALTALTLTEAIARHAPRASTVYVCGGGAFNGNLMQRITAALRALGHPASVTTTDALGVSPDHVEALAFAWLAQQFVERRAGNLPAVTGARSDRILGALYPAHVII